MSDPSSDLDLVRTVPLVRWMDEQRLPGSGESIEGITQLAGGAANAIFRFRRGAQEFVLRRPPRHPRPESAKTMLREARVLGALSDSDVPHPRLIALCEDAAVLGAPFYLMAPIDGFNPSGELPEAFDSDAARHRMGIELVDAIARLARVDPFAVGLEGFGKPEGFLERQVGRWRSQLDSYARFEGYTPRALPGLAPVSDWLGANLPRDYRPGLIHGDYQFANVMFAHDRPELVAVIDWELSTLGDPLIDLGWILATWQDPDEEGSAAYIQPWRGFPSRRELVEHYLGRVDRDPAAIRWFRTLACYKLGILLEGNYARGLAGLASRELGDIMGDVTWRLFEQAERLVRDEVPAF